MSDSNAGPALRGRVIDWQTGQGVEEPTVTLFRIDDHRDLVFEAQGEGEESGRFSFPLQDGGRYLVLASHLDYFANYGHFDAGPEGADLELALLPHGFEGIGPPSVSLE